MFKQFKFNIKGFEQLQSTKWSRPDKLKQGKKMSSYLIKLEAEQEFE